MLACPQTPLKERLRAIIPREIDRVKKIKAQHGEKPLGSCTVEQVRVALVARGPCACLWMERTHAHTHTYTHAHCERLAAAHSLRNDASRASRRPMEVCAELRR